jgi:4,5-DOPA dioxygenase extradiol
MSSMPALFLGHGSPMNAIEPGPATKFWKTLAAELPRPKAILCISAHWLTRGTCVTTALHPETIHDFGGFPRALHEVQYPAPGSPSLAHRIQQLLSPVAVLEDSQWGLDHGTWSLLLHMYPEADIPVVQLSLDVKLRNAEHYALASRLQALREEGVLILGSGNVVHNLQRLQSAAASPPPAWALEFETIVKAAILTGDHQALIEYQQIGDTARLAVPTSEHYLPLLYVLAQQRSGEAAKVPFTGIELGTISMLCAQVGSI